MRTIGQLTRVAVAVAGLTLAAGAADAQVWGRSLGPEAPGATGSGSVLVRYDAATFGLTIEADWAGLSGTTTVAHIHCCTAVPEAGTVGVAVTPGTLPGFPVGTMVGSYASPVIDLNDAASFTAGFVNNFGGGTLAGARAALFAGMTNGTAYFNVHTTAFPGGEIRGFLTAVPEPSTYALLATGLGVIGGISWRRRRTG